jgi:hypothetical protein
MELFCRPTFPALVLHGGKQSRTDDILSESAGGIATASFYRQRQCDIPGDRNAL